MSAPPWLASAQARIRALVTAPEGVAAALRAEGDAGARALAGLVRGDDVLPATARLGVYAHAFFERLRSALGKDFPDLARALGEDAFHDLVRVYLMIHPPGRPSIRDAGAALAGFLQQDESAAFFRQRLPCAGDLAAFEWAQTEVFDAPDVALLAREDLARVAPEAWGDLRLETIPALRVLRLGWPVHTLPAAAGPAEAAALAPRATALLVWRQDERVRFRVPTGPEAAVLTLAAEGACFGDLCDVLAGEVGAAQAPAVAAGHLARWIDDRCLRG